MREGREDALSFLDAISSNLAGEGREHKFIEKRIRELMVDAQEESGRMTSEIGNLQHEIKMLTGKIKKKQTDLDRNEKRFKSLKSVRPAFMDEYERLEEELSRQYKVYLERFRNLDYLEYELKNMERAESHQLQDSDRQMQRLQKKLRDEELSLLRGEAGRGGRTAVGGVQQADSDRAPQQRPTSASRKGKARGPGSSKMTGKMDGSNLDDDDDSGDDGSSGDFSRSEDDSEDVSMGSSGASDGEDLSDDSELSDSESGEFSDDVDGEESDEDF